MRGVLGIHATRHTDYLIPNSEPKNTTIRYPFWVFCHSLCEILIILAEIQLRSLSEQSSCLENYMPTISTNHFVSQQKKKMMEDIDENSCPRKVDEELNVLNWWWKAEEKTLIASNNSLKVDHSVWHNHLPFVNMEILIIPIPHMNILHIWLS